MERSFLKLASFAIGAAALIAASPMVLTTPPRPEADVKRDSDRKPLDMLNFAKVSDGQTVVDFLPGGGYFTRLFSAAVGPKGKVIAYVPEMLASRRPEVVTKLRAMAAEGGHENVAVAVGAGSPLAADGTADLIWTSENYHDLHNIPGDAAGAINKAAYAALKHGGYYVVDDHAAEAGSGARDTNTLHRIDPAVVRTEVTAAGFVFDGETKVLVNPADTHTLNVFDPAIRGHTDQFVHRFRKP